MLGQVRSVALKQLLMAQVHHRRARGTLQPRARKLPQQLRASALSLPCALARRDTRVLVRASHLRQDGAHEHAQVDRFLDTSMFVVRRIEAQRGQAGI